ncbi:hypothetical protein [Tessaracoccus sp.]
MRTKPVKVGSIFVDAGIVMVGDPCYTLPDEASHRDETAKSWTVFCDKMEAARHADPDGPGVFTPWNPGTAIVIPAGHGDGEYPVFVTLDSESCVAELTILFDTPEDPDRARDFGYYAVSPATNLAGNPDMTAAPETLEGTTMHTNSTGGPADRHTNGLSSVRRDLLTFLEYLVDAEHVVPADFEPDDAQWVVTEYERAVAERNADVRIGVDGVRRTGHGGGNPGQVVDEDGNPSTFEIERDKVAWARDFPRSSLRATE